MTVIGLISRPSSTRCSRNEYLGDDDDTKTSQTVLATQLLHYHKKTCTHTTGRFINCIT